LKRLVSLLALLSFPALAQVNEVIEVRVTEVEVVVVDGHGKPVSGLTKNDFELREGGKPREITNFYAVERGQLLREAAPAPAAATPAPAEAALPAPPTHLAFFVDNVHLDLRQRNRVLDAVKRFAEANVSGGVTASLLTYNHDGARVRVPFTSDKTKILAAIDEMEHESARLTEMVSERRSITRRIDAAVSDVRRDPDEVEKIWRAILMYSDGQAHELENSLSAAGDAIRRLSGVPGRKVLVHISSGLPLQPGIELMDYWRQAFGADPAMVNMQGLQIEKTRSFERLIKFAQANGVIVDTIDAGGIWGSASGVEDAGGAASLDTQLTRDNSRQTLQLIADETGGRSIINENDFDRALLDIAADTTTYYSLGFHSSDGASDALKKIDVRVKRPGLTVHATKAVRDRTFEERVLDAIQSAFDFPLDINPLGASLEIGALRIDSDGMPAVPVRLTVDPSKLVALPGEGSKVAHVRCYYEVRDGRGGMSNPRVVDQTIVVDDMTVPLQITRVAGLRLRRGRYTLSLAVRDLTTNETAYVQKSLVVDR
jgi:VWFA-related protein